MEVAGLIKSGGWLENDSKLSKHLEQTAALYSADDQIIYFRKFIFLTQDVSPKSQSMHDYSPPNYVLLTSITSVLLGKSRDDVLWRSSCPGKRRTRVAQWKTLL